MTFWDWADKHPANAEAIIVIATIALAIAAVRIVAWISCGAANVAKQRAKRDAQSAREHELTFQRTGAGEQA